MIHSPITDIVLYQYSTTFTGRSCLHKLLRSKLLCISSSRICCCCCFILLFGWQDRNRQTLFVWQGWSWRSQSWCNVPPVINCCPPLPLNQYNINYFSLTLLLLLPPPVTVDEWYLLLLLLLSSVWLGWVGGSLSLSLSLSLFLLEKHDDINIKLKSFAQCVVWCWPTSSIA